MYCFNCSSIEKFAQISQTLSFSRFYLFRQFFRHFSRYYSFRHVFRRLCLFRRLLTIVFVYFVVCWQICILSIINNELLNDEFVNSTRFLNLSIIRVLFLINFIYLSNTSSNEFICFVLIKSTIFFFYKFSFYLRFRI